MIINNKTNEYSSSDLNKTYPTCIYMYIKETTSNTFISLYKKMVITYLTRSVTNYKLVRLFSCGNSKTSKIKKDSLIAINNLARKCAIYIIRRGVKNVHIIIESTSIFRKFIVYNILNTKYMGTKLNLLSLVDVIKNSYTRYKIKKDKKR